MEMNELGFDPRDKSAIFICLTECELFAVVGENTALTTVPTTPSTVTTTPFEDTTTTTTTPFDDTTTTTTTPFDDTTTTTTTPFDDSTTTTTPFDDSTPSTLSTTEPTEPPPTTTPSPQDDTINEVQEEIHEIVHSLNNTITEQEFDKKLDETIAELDKIIKPEVIEQLKPENATIISKNACEIVDRLLSKENVWKNETSETSNSERASRIFTIIDSIALIMNAKVSSEKDFYYRREHLYVKTVRFGMLNIDSLSFELDKDQWGKFVTIKVLFASLNVTPIDHISATFSVIFKTPIEKEEFLSFGPKRVNTRIFGLILEQGYEIDPGKEFKFE